MISTELAIAIAACQDAMCVEGEGCATHRAASNAERLVGVEPAPAEDVAALVAAAWASPVYDW